jgi:hypothetical protein
LLIFLSYRTILTTAILFISLLIGVGLSVTINAESRREEVLVHQITLALDEMKIGLVQVVTDLVHAC